MAQRREVKHRGYTGEAFGVPSAIAWSLIVPEGGQVGVDGCVQYGDTLIYSWMGIDEAERRLRSFVDRAIEGGILVDREAGTPC